MTPLEKISYLSIALPHDIVSAKEAGYFDIAQQLIEVKLADVNLPDSLRIRLQLEKEVLRRLPAAYPYTLKDGLSIIQKEIPDYTMQELLREVHADRADWIYIDGNVHLQDRFYLSLKKTNAQLALRAHEAVSKKNLLLDQNMEDMKRNGHACWHIHLKTTLQIHDDAFEKGHSVLVHLPVVTASDNMHNIEILSCSDSGTVDVEQSASRTVAFQKITESNDPFVVEYAYDSEVNYHEVRQGIPFRGKSSFLEEQAPHIVFTPTLRMLSKEIVGDEKDPAETARRIYDFITRKVQYSYMRPYFLLNDIPAYCASSLKGDCGVQALLFITLCRLNGIPARWQSGKFVTPQSTGNHDWAQFYVEPYGWLYADCSFGGSAYRNGNESRRQFYFGNLDPFRMAANNAFQQEFTIKKNYLRNDPYDNQIGEVEYDDHGLSAKDFTSRTEVIEMYKS